MSSSLLRLRARLGTHTGILINFSSYFNYLRHLCLLIPPTLIKSSIVVFKDVYLVMLDKLAVCG
jgi:hypothetical protein